MRQATSTHDRYGRLLYHPAIHTRHGQPWTNEEQKYLIERYELDGPEAVSFALGRTIHIVMHRACQLRKEKLMPKRTTRQRFTRSGSKKGKDE